MLPKNKQTDKQTDIPKTVKSLNIVSRNFLPFYGFSFHLTISIAVQNTFNFIETHLPGVDISY